MNLVNPATLYGSGLATFDAKPYIQAAERAAARKAAKDEALDKYYQNLPNTINEQGVRDAEIPLLHNIKDGIQSYWIKNKEAIKRGNTPEAFNYGKMFRDAQGVVVESKNRAKTSDAVAKLRGNPKYDYIFKDPKLMDKIANHDKTLGDENSKAIDFNQLTLPPPPFDAAKHMTGVKVKPQPDTPTYQPIQGDRFNRLEITPQKFSPEDLNAIHIYSQTQLENNPSFEIQIKEKVKESPELAAKLAGIFEKNYGHPIKTNEDLAAAYTLSMMDLSPKQTTKLNREELEKAKNEEWNRRNKITFGQSMARIKANKKAQEAPDTPYLTDEYFDRYGKGFSDNEIPTVTRIAGFTPQGYVEAKDIHPNDIGTITGRDAAKKMVGVKPITVGEKSVYLVTPDGDWVGEGGARINRETVRNVVIEKRVNTKYKAQTENKKSGYDSKTPNKQKGKYD